MERVGIKHLHATQQGKGNDPEYCMSAGCVYFSSIWSLIWLGCQAQFICLTNLNSTSTTGSCLFQSLMKHISIWGTERRSPQRKLSTHLPHTPACRSLSKNHILILLCAYQASGIQTVIMEMIGGRRARGVKMRHINEPGLMTVCLCWH